jgi:hypothetical protein
MTNEELDREAKLRLKFVGNAIYTNLNEAANSAAFFGMNYESFLDLATKAYRLYEDLYLPEDVSVDPLADTGPAETIRPKE